MCDCMRLYPDSWAVANGFGWMGMDLEDMMEISDKEIWEEVRG